MSCLPAPCSWCSIRGRQAACTAESVWTGQRRSGKRSLRTVRVHSRRIRQPALSLQRQPHCSGSRDERQLERREGGETIEKTERRTGGKASALIPPQQSPKMMLTLFPARPSGYLTTFPCPLCWLHATSLSLSPLPHLLPVSLLFPFSPPSPPPILSLSPLSAPSSLPPSAYPPPHLLTRGVYADSGTFVRVFVKIREKFCSAG